MTLSPFYFATGGIFFQFNRKQLSQTNLASPKLNMIYQ